MQIKVYIFCSLCVFFLWFPRSISAIKRCASLSRTLPCLHLVTSLIKKHLNKHTHDHETSLQDENVTASGISRVSAQICSACARVCRRNPTQKSLSRVAINVHRCLSLYLAQSHPWSSVVPISCLHSLSAKTHVGFKGVSTKESQDVAFQASCRATLKRTAETNSGIAFDGAATTLAFECQTDTSQSYLR